MCLPLERGTELLADCGDGREVAHFVSCGSSRQGVVFVGGGGQSVNTYLCGVLGVRQQCQATFVESL